MSELRINLSDYKASGVYFVEIDNSVITRRAYNSASRLAVGFSTVGPFNRPVFLSGPADVTQLFGGIDRKLERKGCFTNRNIRTMVSKTPIFAINLMPIDTREKEDNADVVGYSTLSLTADHKNYTGHTLYAYLYDRSRFWIADDNTFVKNVFLASANNEQTEDDEDEFDNTAIKDYALAAPFGIGNCGTKDFSLIVRKAEGLSGYNVTFLDWYGNEESIPYKWVNPRDYVSDYFVQVIAVAGKWDEETYKAYSTDIVWGNYFTESGLRRDKLSKFLRLDTVNVIGNWTGCILPNFTDKQGNDKSIDYLINKSCNSTGVLWGVNSNALDALCLSNRFIDDNGDVSIGTEYNYFVDMDGDGAYDQDNDKEAYYKIDPCGHTLDASSGTPTVENFLSYHFADDLTKYIGTVNAYVDEVEDTYTLLSTQFATVEDPSALEPATDSIEINVGDFVRTVDNLMTRIAKKRKFKNPSTGDIITVYTALNEIKNLAENENEDGTNATVEIHKNYTEMYDTLRFIPLEGLKIRNKHIPGYDKNGNLDPEAGVEKIYSMLYDEGIHKGLLNEDSIDFRYIVDTMAYGMGPECGGKKYLAKLAGEKGHCTALCNVPSMSQFANSDGTYAPYFCATFEPGEEPKPSFNVKYIAEGGNQDMVYSNPDIASFSLPTEENGAKNSGFFAPFFKYIEGSKTILVPPAADISNTFVGRFIVGNPYATVANYNGIIVNSQISDVEYLFDKEDRGYLEPFGINPVIMRQGNIMIYGDRTAYQTVNSDLSFLHVRELVNTIEIECKNVLDKYVFTYNTPLVRAEIVSRLNPILSAMKDSQALVKYEIQCDENNNTKEIIDDKFCIVDIGIWVSQNMEKIVTRITLNRSTTAEV
ncbi:MAG: hypothetical protein II699_05120 [Lachnospiraceae bacterium]|nr:hypothetical protein [Lachnospiraceae bacterium]